MRGPPGRRRCTATCSRPSTTPARWAGICSCRRERHLRARILTSSLATTRGPAAIAALDALLKGSATTAVKQRAIWVLTVSADEASLPPLRHALTSTSEIAATAARALGLRRDKKAAPALAKLLAAKEPF